VRDRVCFTDERVFERIAKPPPRGPSAVLAPFLLRRLLALLGPLYGWRGIFSSAPECFLGSSVRNRLSVNVSADEIDFVAALRAPHRDERRRML
jgi:hypothetical protein